MWDPKRYLQFESHRTRPVYELIARIPLEAPSLIFDLGCGPGNSTAVLCERWPEARVIGIDNSDEMLDQARKKYPQTEWHRGDISDWKPQSPPDLVFANASLQWVPEPERIAARIFSFVAPGGVLAFQVPANLDGPPHTLIDESLAELGLEARIDHTKLSRFVLPAHAYYRVLAGEGATVDIWDTEYLQALEGEDAVLSWIKGTALVPILSQLDDTDAADFLEDLTPRLRFVYRTEAGGETLMPFRRQFVVAHRST